MTNLKLKMLLAALCCFALVLMIPVPSSAQLGGAVKHGVQKGYEKTKEGVQDVEQGTKKAITGEDNDQQQQQQNKEQQQGTTRMKPSETPATGSTETETQQKSTTETEKTGQKHMPKTAGELPLLALAGCLSLAIAGATRRSRRSHS
jgi:hypothetical protein